MLHPMGISGIPLDISDNEDITVPTVHLLSALQVDKLPALRIDGVVLQGIDAFLWGEAQSHSVSTKKGYTSCTDLVVKHIKPSSTRTLDDYYYP